MLSSFRAAPAPDAELCWAAELALATCRSSGRFGGGIVVLEVACGDSRGCGKEMVKSRVDVGTLMAGWVAAGKLSRR